MRKISTLGAVVTVTTVAAAMLSLAGAAQAAGVAEVKWIEPEKFHDIGLGSFDRERNQQALEDIFRQLARQLPEGQTLKIEVLQVDLAGEMRPGSVRDFRIVRGGVDWPRLSVRYSLQAGAQTVKAGQAQIADMNYLFGTRPVQASEGPLPYEKRMLTRWFEETFGNDKP
jgi:hypothetical protein